MTVKNRRFPVPGVVWLSLLVLGCSGSSSGAPSSTDAPGVPAITDGSSNEHRDGGEDERDGASDYLHDAGADAADAAKEGGNVIDPSCNGRVDGAWITFDVGTETLTVWSTNEKFNIEAHLAASQGKLVTPVFGNLIDGVDCDGQWSWHPDPEDLSFAASDPSCAGLPSDIEGNKAHWLNGVDRYCPSGVLISQFQVDQ